MDLRINVRDEYPPEDLKRSLPQSCFRTPYCNHCIEDINNSLAMIHLALCDKEAMKDKEDLHTLQSIRTDLNIKIMDYEPKIYYRTITPEEFENYRYWILQKYKVECDLKESKLEEKVERWKEMIHSLIARTRKNGCNCILVSDPIPLTPVVTNN